MSNSPKNRKEDFGLVWTELLIAVATIACSALLLLALHKTDFAAWMFLVILAACGAVACVILCLKVRKDYISASADEKPKRSLALSIALTGVATVAFLALFLITLILFLV